MVKITVLFSTNGSEDEMANLDIDRYAIKDFTRVGYAENIYDATVIFECMPRATNPDFMQIIMNINEIGDTIIILGTICKQIVKFVKKCRGYEKAIYIESDKEDIASISITDNMDEKELEERIKEKLIVYKEEKASK